MAEWMGYIAVEDLALTDDQRAAILAAFDDLGPTSDGQPGRLLRRRVRLDGLAAIYAAAFRNVDNLSVENVKQFLADAVGVNPAIISTNTQQTARGPLVTFSAAGTDRLRMLAFGGLSADKDASNAECLKYLYTNRVAWGDAEA